MLDKTERQDALAIVKMFSYLERELRCSLGEEHLARLSGIIAEDLERRYDIRDSAGSHSIASVSLPNQSPDHFHVRGYRPASTSQT